MARTSLSTPDLVIGIILVVLGGLALLGWVNLGWVVIIAAIAAIVVGILVLLGRARGHMALGIILLVVGIILLIPRFPGADRIGGALETVAAVVLLILGILKLLGKW